MMKNLSGRTALVTGAARRIGRQISISLAEAGCDVVLHYSRSETEALELKGDIERKGQRAWTVRQVFASIDSADALMKSVKEKAGSVDILVNSASTFPSGFESSPDGADFESVLNVNALIPWRLTTLFAAQTESGDVVNLLDSRISGHDIGRPAYYLSKQMLRHITEQTALGLAPSIRVNAVAPGLALPPLGRGIDYFEKLKGDVPLKTYGSPADVADAVLFLLRSSYITGQIIYVDGGQHLTARIYGTRP
jgi:pteridine reductase